MRGRIVRLLAMAALVAAYYAVLSAAAWVADTYPPEAVAGAAYMGVIMLAAFAGAILRDQGRR